eukprot:CAMPEP_0167820442 /NCGR_PEP_ID=MMETSP0112_2-20121227/6093_1 /TAXON_ID=91324 /ORGANISM="Lotharella globosa, Strain CCCM811" /LENGTH=685 /DNA_ID=CAMNT_0007720999 /DNA_START=26 /DNA_END=2083 /DNA_ORIENTATION=+
MARHNIGPTGFCGPACKAMLPYIYSGIFLVCLGQFVGFTIWLNRNRRRAAIWADKNAARNTILPIYDWVLYWEIFYILARAGFIYCIQQRFANYLWGTTIVFCASKMSQYFVVAYLVQHRMGYAAVLRAVSVALWLFLITVVLHVKNRLWEYLLDLILFSSVLCYACGQRTGRYTWFLWYVSYLVVLTSIAACMFGGLVKASLKFRFGILIFSDFCRVAVHPVLLLMVLLTDSQWWRSLSDSIIRMGVRSSTSFRRLGNSGTSSRSWSQKRSRSSMELGEDLPLTSVQETLRTHLQLIDFCTLDFYSTQYLDRGSKGEVRRCRWKPKEDSKGREVALKTFGRTDISLEEMLQIGKEAFLSARLEHPNIVKFFGISIQPPSVHLVYEYCSERSLRHVLRDSARRLSWGQRVRFALQAARGLSALHRQEIIHRDIKSRNYLVHFNGKEFVVKLCDFGSARFLGAPGGSQGPSPLERRTSYSGTGCTRAILNLMCGNKRNGGSHPTGRRHEASDERYMTYMTAVVGTLAYMAPELMPADFPFTSDSIGPASYGFSADTFSFGYVLWELLTRRLPYYALKDVRTLLRSVLNGGRPPAPTCPTTYKKLMQWCWHADPSQRPTADEIVEDLQSVLEKSMKMEFECVEVSHPSYEGVSFPSSTSMQSLQKGLYQEDLQNIRKTEELRTPREA